MPKVLDHTHTYVKWKVQFGELHFKCADPDCLHSAPISLLEGKRSKCAICHTEDLILTRKDFLRAKPRCENCSNTKEAIKKRKFKGLVSEMFSEPLVPEIALVESEESKDENV